MAADKMNLAFAVRMDAARTEANGIRCPLFPPHLHFSRRRLIFSAIYGIIREINFAGCPGGVRNQYRKEQAAADIRSNRAAG